MYDLLLAISQNLMVKYIIMSLVTVLVILFMTATMLSFVNLKVKVSRSFRKKILKWHIALILLIAFALNGAYYIPLIVGSTAPH